MDNIFPIAQVNYLSLQAVLDAAYAQAAEGKGNERHAQDLPFDSQPMQTICQLVGDHHGLIYQAIKKSQESIRMEPNAAAREMLGAINYLAGAILFLKKQHGFTFEELR